jgi:hypothetical protein
VYVPPPGYTILYLNLSSYVLASMFYIVTTSYDSVNSRVSIIRRVASSLLQAMLMRVLTNVNNSNNNNNNSCVCRAIFRASVYIYVRINVEFGI